jgi:shikimate 5-dehydrogenase
MQSTISKSQIRQYLTTAQEAMYTIYASNTLDPLNLMILGGSVFYSLSPAMYTAAFEVCGLRNTFQAVGVSSISEIEMYGRENSFGGAAITSPFKVCSPSIQYIHNLTFLRYK